MNKGFHSLGRRALRRVPRAVQRAVPLCLLLMFARAGLAANEAAYEPGAFSASRSQGPAPLSVHFQPDYPGDASQARAFHRYEYEWDFGDPGSGAWGSTGAPKNSAKGAVCAHVFENPGKYQVKLSVRNGSSVVKTAAFDITVSDPDAFYAGANTICVSDKAHPDFAGAPAGARKVSTDDLREVTGFAATGKRILFRRGSSWTANGLAWPACEGPVTIGAFGKGLNPDALGIFENAPRIAVASGSFMQLDGKQDWRIMDLRLQDPTRSADSLGGGLEIQRLLFLRLKIEGFANTLGWSHWNSAKLMPIDQMAIVSCDLSEGKGYVLYVGSERLALLGNRLHNARDSHVVRVWQAYKSVISDNVISGASLDSPNGRHALKLHGPGNSALDGVKELGAPVPDTGLLEKRTEFVVVSGNVFGSSGPWPVAIGPQDSGANEALSNIIFERNRIISDYGAQNSMQANMALHVWCRYATVRNNLLDGRGSGNDYSGIIVEQRGVEPAPVGVEVYNNTIVRTDNKSGNERFGIVIGKTAKGTIVKNNLVAFPNASVPVFLIQDLSGSSQTGGNLLLKSAPFADAANASPLARDYRLAAGGAGVDQGVDAPVSEDFSGRRRPNGAFDIGAYEK